VNWRSMGSGGGFHYACTPFEFLQAGTSPLVIYVPAEAVHQPVNDGLEPMELIVARNAPVEIVVEVAAEKARD